MRWPERPPYLALNPSYFLFVLYFCFFSLFLMEKLFSPRNGHFCLFLSVSFCFPLIIFGLPPFQFLFQFLFLSLSLSLSLLLFPFLFFYAICLVPCFCFFSLFFCFLCLCFMKGTTSKYSIAKMLSQSFLFGFLSCFSLKSLFIFVIFLILSCVFFNINVLGFKKHKLKKNTNFWSRGGLQQNGFCYEPVFCKM